MWGPCPACGRERECGDVPLECEPWHGMWLIVGGEQLGDEDEVSLDTGRSSNYGVARTRLGTNDEVSLDSNSSCNDMDGRPAAPAPMPATGVPWKAPPTPAPPGSGLEAWRAPPPCNAYPEQCPAGECVAAAPPPFFKAAPKQCLAAPNPPSYKEPRRRPLNDAREKLLRIAIPKPLHEAFK